MRKAWRLEPGRVPYVPAWAVQKKLAGLRAVGAIHDGVILLEHDPVYTLGRQAQPEHVLYSDAERVARGIDLVRVDRGGDVTYHGPGQLVGYPILKLEDFGLGVVDYVRDLEEALIEAVAAFGVEARRIEGLTGVWSEAGKVAAIGVKVTRGVTTHGFALNVDPDPEHWRGIVACGLADRQVASLARLLGRAPDMAEVTSAVARALGRRFGLRYTAPVPVGLNWFQEEVHVG